MKKRILSMLLVIVMVLSLVPVSALAEGAISVAGLPQTAAVGGAVIFSATVDGNPITDATWESSDLNIAKPIRIEGTNQCRIEGVGQGAAKITVKKEGLTDGVRWASFYIKQDSVAIEGPTTVTAGENVKLSFAVPEGVTQKNVKWTLDESCTTYASMDSETANPMTLSVNANAVGKKVKVNLSFNGAENTKELEIVAPTPGKITVTEPSDLHNVCVGKSLTLTAKIDVNPANADFTVDKEGIVDIAKSGNVFTVTGKAPGEVTINFTMTGSQNRKYEGSYKVTVDPLKTMEIRADSDAFFTGKTVQLRAFEGDKELTGVVWWCDTPSVANAARETGLLTCVGAGPAKVKARLDNYNDAWLPITVAANTLQIQSKADKKAVSQINVGDEIQLEVVDAAGDAVAVDSWSSSNDTAATVTDGLLKGLKKSDTAVTIIANVSGTEVKQEITVNNKSFKVKNGSEELNSDSVLSIYVGDTITLTAVDGKTARWDSDKDDKATIDRHDGILVGIAPTGEDETVLINVDVDGYDRASFRVKVLNKNTFIKLRLDNPDVRPTDLAVGETRQLVALKDTTSGPVEGVKWDITGGTGKAELVGENKDQLTGKADGTVELTATCYGFETKNVEIYVSTEKLNSVTIPTSLELNEGETKDLLADAVFDPVYASDKTVTFRPKEAKDADVVEIDGSIVKAKRYGTATVTGTYMSGTEEKNVEVTVTVKASNHIELVELDPTIPTELVCGDTLELKAVLKNAAGETLETPVQWQLNNDNAIKNLVDLTGNKLTAHPQSTYDFNVILEAFVEGNDQVEPIFVTVHVIPRTTNIALKKGDEDISDKTIVLNVNDPNGITIDAVIKPNDASQVVDWEIDGPNSIYKATQSDKGIKIEPVITQKTGTITVTATAKDGTGISCKTTIVFAKMADRVVITNAPGMMMGGANIQLRTNLDEDKTITERSVKWSIVDETGKEGNTRYASVTADGLLDTKSVTERTKIYVQATMLANPINPDVKEIWLCPAVNRINIMQQTGEIDKAGNPILANVKNVVDYSEKTIKLDKVEYPAGHIASFVWDSSNKAVADFVPGTSELQLKGAGKTQITCTATDGSNTRGVYNLEVVKTAGYVEIDEVGELVSGKNTVLTATVYTEDGTELAANQKVTWSVEDEYGNPTKAATINSRGRLYAKTVKYGTEVVVVAKSVENKDAEPGRISVTIKPKQTKTFMAVMTADPEGIILGSSLDLNVGVETSIFGQWYISEDNEFDREYDCTYNSSNRNVATIDPEGTLETLKSGSTVITVRATDPDTHNVYTTKFTLRVANLVGHVHIAEADKSLTMRSGQSMNLKASAWTDSGMATKSDNQGFIWKVYQQDEETGEYIIAKAASVSSSGKVYANSVTKNTMVWVEAISRENSEQISSPCPIMIRPKNVYTPKVFFESEERDENGYPKELSGTVSRSITSNPMDIQVRAYASDPSFDPERFDGQYCDPTVFGITWSSSNKKVIDVVGNELVYKDTGKATVTAKFTVNRITYSASITINVVRPVTSLTVTSRTSSLDMYAGKSLLMLAKVNSDATNKRVEWSFFDEDDYEIASINSTTGLIRAKKGLTDRETVTVVAKTTDGSEITSVPVTVTIYPLATKVEIDEDPYITLEKGDDETVLTATVYPDGDLGANQKVTWSSSRSSIVSVDKDGKLVAKKRGTATIKAKAVDGSGKYATIKITVVNP